MTAIERRRFRRGDMTPRARGYLIVAACRHFGIGLCAVVAPAAFTSRSLAAIRDVMSLPSWGVFLFVVALACLTAATSGSEATARVSLVLSAAASTTWAAGFLSAAMNHDLSNPALPIVFAALAAKDLIVCAQPLRSPFERLAERLDQR